jgi:DNA ligase-1
MDILLAKRWDGEMDPTGWLVSTKLDGWRAPWDGSKFISRGGSVITSPGWFTKGLPGEPLDGEIWAGNGGFERVTSTAGGSRELDWNAVVYAVFDAPEFPGGFEVRIAHAKRILKNAAHGIVIPFWVCKSKAQLLKKLDEVIAAGGEGLMLRKPGSVYERKRSDTLLKVKKWHDAEAVIIEHVQGTRRGLTGSLKVITKEGLVFKVIGLTEKMAHTPPRIGTVITYRYHTLSKNGTPRPAVFWRERKEF